MPFLPPPAASAAEESPPPKRSHITFLSEVKEEGDIPAQVTMVTEEDGAPQVALITQDGTQQVQALELRVREELSYCRQNHTVIVEGEVVINRTYVCVSVMAPRLVGGSRS